MGNDIKDREILSALDRNSRASLQHRLTLLGTAEFMLVRRRLFTKLVKFHPLWRIALAGEMDGPKDGIQDRTRIRQDVEIADPASTYHPGWSRTPDGEHAST